MSKLRIPGLLGIAVAASLAFAAAASADTVTSPTGTSYTGEIKAHAEGHTITHNPIAKVECASTFAFLVENHPAGGKVSGKVTSMNTSPCTNDWHVTVINAGVLAIEHKNYGDGRAYDGDVYSDQLTVEKTRFGVTCRYRTETTTIGRLTAGTPATIDINGTLPFHSGSFLCGSGGTLMTGQYLITTPGSLFVDNT